MKSVRNLFMAGCAGILALASCSSDDSGDVIGRNPIRFNSGIETRAVDQTWGNDAIGVYMIENGSTLSATSIVDGAANKKFTTAGTGDFVHATQSDQIRFPESGSVDFIAYYPYRQTITDYKYPIDVSDQTESADIDFMYAKADGYSKSSSSVTLTFKHSLSAIRLSIEDQEGNSLSGMTVALEGLNTEAEYSLVDKSITNLSNIADIETVVSNVSGAAAQADAILIPASGLSGVNLKIYVPSSGMEYNEDFNYELKAETRHLYAIVLKGDGTVTLQPTGNIDGWDTEDNTGNPIEIDPDGAEAGTKANPYGVGDLDASLVGETVWVEGYIVGAEESGALVTSGISTQSNIVIAASAGETNLANCVLVDISTDTDVEGALNLVDNDDLLGQSVKVLGTVAAGGTTAYALNNVTDQEGGNEPGSGGAELQFLETFGPSWREGTSGTLTDKWDAFVARDQFDMKAPIVYSTGSDEVDFRCTNNYDNPHIWFAANYDKLFKIEGIESGFSNMTISFDLAANSANASSKAMIVKCNGVEVTLPSVTLGTSNTFSTISASIPDGTTTVEFITTPTSNTIGYRLDNIKITGTK